MRIQRLLKYSLLIPSALLFILPAGCAPEGNIVTQFSTIDALLAGSYDGFIELSEVDRAGNLGIGTFDRLDGEMILLDDVFWQSRSDGKIIRMDKNVTTPFASVCQFEPETTGDLEAEPSMSALLGRLDGSCTDVNGIYAVRIRGDFGPVRVRAVPAQRKPYPPLAEVTRDQPEFELTGSSGTVVGFRLPPFVKGLNVPGWHLHYLSEDHSFGGHILQLELKEGVYEIDSLNRLMVQLDETGRGMAGLDLTRDRSEELKQVEGGE